MTLRLWRMMRGGREGGRLIVKAKERGSKMREEPSFSSSVENVSAVKKQHCEETRCPQQVFIRAKPNQ